jgi:hypothetical protein
MIFVAIGLVLAAPSVLHFGNRICEEVLLPNKDMRALKKRRAEQAAAGVPEEEREELIHMPLHGLDLRLTPEENDKLEKMGAIEIMARAAHRNASAKRLQKRLDEDAQAA